MGHPVFAALLALVGLLLTEPVELLVARSCAKEPLAPPWWRCRSCVDSSPRLKPGASRHTPHFGERPMGLRRVPVFHQALGGAPCTTCGSASAVPPGRPIYLSFVMPAALGLLAARIGPEPQLAAFSVATVGMVAIAAVDLSCGRIPNRLLYPTSFLTLVAMAATAGVDGRWGGLAGAVAAGAVACAFVGFIHLVRPDGMGMGDVRLAGLVGLVAGWTASWYVLVLLALLIGFFAGAVAGTVIAVVHRTGRATRLCFGPYLVLGAFAIVLWQPHFG